MQGLNTDHRLSPHLARTLLVLLVALLLCAQHAAVVHSLWHLVGHGGVHAAQSVAQAQDPQTKDDDAYCDKCFQFAHVSGVSISSFAAPALPAAAIELAQTPGVAIAAADVPSARSRGPPAAL
jgi:hypothetical protein